MDNIQEEIGEWDIVDTTNKKNTITKSQEKSLKQYQEGIEKQQARILENFKKNRTSDDKKFK